MQLAGRQGGTWDRYSFWAIALRNAPAWHSSWNLRDTAAGEADSLPDAVKLLGKEFYDLVLADATVGNADSEQILRSLKGASPRLSVMILADEGSPVVDDVITSPLTSMQNFSPQYPAVSKGEAFLLLLPEQDSLKMLPDLPQTAGLLNKLALIYQSQQKFTAAEQLYKRALEISGKTPGDQSREAASIMMNLATLYHEQKKYGEAEKLYRSSLDLAEKAHGPNHPKVARTAATTGGTLPRPGQREGSEADPRASR